MRVWLRDIRLQKKLTQELTANKSKISRSYYTHIESGKKTPTVETAKGIALTLGFEWTIFFENQRSYMEQTIIE